MSGPELQDRLIKLGVMLPMHAIVRDERHSLREKQASLATLTARQRQVFDLVVRGRSNKQTAVELGATERTIKAHRRQVMEKMKVKSLVTIAERFGFLGQS